MVRRRRDPSATRTALSPHSNCLSLNSSNLGIPFRLMLDHRVDNREQLSHGRHQRNLGRFTGVAEPAIKRAKDGVMPSPGDGRHVEHGAHRRAATPNMPLAALLATVAVEGGD